MKSTAKISREVCCHYQKSDWLERSYAWKMFSGSRLLPLEEGRGEVIPWGFHITEFEAGHHARPEPTKAWTFSWSYSLTLMTAAESGECHLCPSAQFVPCCFAVLLLASCQALAMQVGRCCHWNGHDWFNCGCLSNCSPCIYSGPIAQLCKHPRTMCGRIGNIARNR